MLGGPLVDDGEAGLEVRDQDQRRLVGQGGVDLDGVQRDSALAVDLGLDGVDQLRRWW